VTKWIVFIQAEFKQSGSYEKRLQKGFHMKKGSLHP